ncbi:MAG: D-2-hydroxyacid dehydrogenase [Boseongicola sp.]|nr:D-2-hydroxyacid dehydrogenase [Boseongicola sp.]
MTERPRIILHNDETSSLAKKLAATFPDVAFRECNSYAALPDLVATFQPHVVYSVRFAGSQAYPRDALFGPGGPDWVANGGAGTDHYGMWDPDVCTVTNAAGVAADMMAEYVLGGFLHFTLDIPGLQTDKSERAWNPRTVVPLSGKTLLIIGLGHTGRAIAARAKAFGMHVLGTRATPRAMESVDEVHGSDNLARLLPRADFIAVSTPLTPNTHGLLRRAEIASVKPGAILADVSRGGVVDQAALETALKSKHIAAAVLDVFEVEPLPASSGLWDLENVIISPHCSSVYAGWSEASFDMFLQNLTHWLKGEPLFNVVIPTRGY